MYFMSMIALVASNIAYQKQSAMAVSFIKVMQLAVLRVFGFFNRVHKDMLLTLERLLDHLEQFLHIFAQCRL